MANPSTDEPPETPPDPYLLSERTTADEYLRLLVRLYWESETGIGAAFDPLDIPDPERMLDFIRNTFANFAELVRRGVLIDDFKVEIRFKEPVPIFDYRHYLTTVRWQSRRQQALRSAGFRCQVCNAGGTALDVHHRTYERIGYERPDDLVVLCRECHQLFHDNGKLAGPPKQTR